MIATSTMPAVPATSDEGNVYSRNASVVSMQKKDVSATSEGCRAFQISTATVTPPSKIDGVMKLTFVCEADD